MVYHLEKKEKASRVQYQTQKIPLILMRIFAFIQITVCILKLWQRLIVFILGHFLKNSSLNVKNTDTLFFIIYMYT